MSNQMTLMSPCQGTLVGFRTVFSVKPSIFRIIFARSIMVVVLPNPMLKVSPMATSLVAERIKASTTS